MSAADDDRDDVVFEPAHVVGVWANASRVHRGRDEVTIDFRRRVPDSTDTFRVARVSMPPLAAVELRDQLDQIWQGYTEWPDDV